MIDTTELRRLARVAEDTWNAWNVDGRGFGSNLYDDAREADTAWTSAASPTTILKLLDVVEAARKIRAMSDAACKMAAMLLRINEMMFDRERLLLTHDWLQKNYAVQHLDAALAALDARNETDERGL